MDEFKTVIVIGGGIAGLTAASILVKEGIPAVLVESHSQIGGCAGTFKRGDFIFDVGATQVAGLEFGGIHERIFRYLNASQPVSSILDPGCLVDIGDGSEPISLWHDPVKWKEEREAQFPGSERFWSLCSYLHQSNWSLANRDPIMPVRSHWDLSELIKSFRINNIPSTLFALLTIKDLLFLTGCQRDLRLKKFLDMQLKLYSQEKSDRTAALYGATVLQMAQYPLGLFHIDGSMQNLSKKLVSCFTQKGGKVLLNNKLTNLKKIDSDDSWTLELKNSSGELNYLRAKDVIFTPPPQSLLGLVSDLSISHPGFESRLTSLSKPSGAIVLYGGITRSCLPQNLPGHVQITSKNFESLFISISREGDGRAPVGKATIIASVFTDVDQWFDLSSSDYYQQKRDIAKLIISELNEYLKLTKNDWLHHELATPKSFQKWTNRPKGIVGGLGQDLRNFGPFGLPSRTPLAGLWLCGDSIYPGEGTAGVSQSALMVCKQLMKNRGMETIRLPN